MAIPAAAGSIAGTNAAAVLANTALTIATTAISWCAMAHDQTGKPAHVVGRARLQFTLGAPFVLLLGASVVSWPWRSLGLPGSNGTLTPPAVLLLIVVVIGGVYAVRRGLPAGLITWLPAGQGAVFLLTTGFASESQGSITLAIALTSAYVAVFIMALIVSVMVSAAGFGWGIAFMSFFILTQATRFPVFGAQADASIDNAVLLTLAALTRAIFEIGILAWLARRLVESMEDHTTSVIFGIVLLTFAHGILAGWEEPVVRGALTLTNYGAQAGWWFAASGLQLAAAFVFIRIRRSWFQEPAWAEPVENSETDSPGAKGTEAIIVDLPPVRAARRLRPRRRRR